MFEYVSFISYPDVVDQVSPPWVCFAQMKTESGQDAQSPQTETETEGDHDQRHSHLPVSLRH